MKLWDGYSAGAEWEEWAEAKQSWTLRPAFLVPIGRGEEPGSWRFLFGAMLVTDPVQPGRDAMTVATLADVCENGEAVCVAAYYDTQSPAVKAFGRGSDWGWEAPFIERAARMVPGLMKEGKR